MASRQTPQALGLNDVFRFGLELAAFASLAYGGWVVGGGGAVGVGLALTWSIVPAAVWGVFRVDGDPKPAPVPVPGVVRLAIETLFFASATVALLVADEAALGVALALMVAAHYAFGHRRVRWLLKHPGRLRDGNRLPDGGR